MGIAAFAFCHDVEVERLRVYRPKLLFTSE